MKYAEAFLFLPPESLVMGWGQLDPGRLEWLQPFDRWTAFLYRHTGTVFMNGKAFRVAKGDLVLFPPGSRGGHPKVGEGTQVLYAVFDTPEKARARVAMPLFNKASEAVESEFERVAQGVSESLPRGKAFVWNLLWSLAEPPSAFREQQEMFEAERWISENLARPFQVSELVNHLGVPHRSLLRWFQVQHGRTIKQYVTERRAREACRLLAETSMPVKAVAGKVGVPDLHQFNKLIRSTVGLSPRGFREKSG